jgi:hypothetical protein
MPLLVIAFVVTAHKKQFAEGKQMLYLLQGLGRQSPKVLLC